MPRLTSRHYLSTRSFITQLWDQTDGDALSVLPGQAKRDLHDYFAFTVPMTDQEALTHRTAMTMAFPSLPQSAGRAFQAVRAHAGGQPNQMVDRYLDRVAVSTGQGSRSKKIRVLGVARPKVDVALLARAVTRFLREDLDNQSLEPLRKRPPRK